MSNNYYFRFNKKEEFMHTLYFLLKESTRELFLKEIEDIVKKDIHIGKSYDNRLASVMQKNKYFASVKEIIKFYEKHKDILDIIDEYESKLTFDQLVEELFSNKNLSPFDGFFDDNSCYQDSDGYYFYSREFF